MTSNIIILHSLSDLGLCNTADSSSTCLNQNSEVSLGSDWLHIYESRAYDAGSFSQNCKVWPSRGCQQLQGEERSPQTHLTHTKAQGYSGENYSVHFHSSSRYSDTECPWPDPASPESVKTTLSPLPFKAFVVWDVIKQSNFCGFNTHICSTTSGLLVWRLARALQSSASFPKDSKSLFLSKTFPASISCSEW